MQLILTTDYAIRTVLSLAEKNKIKTASMISEEMVIPEKYLIKVLKKLRAAGIVESIPGAKGGYYLTRDLNEITLGDIFETMEQTMKCNRCLENDGYCSRNATATCKIRKFYQKVQREMEEKVFSVSLTTIIDEF